METGTGGQYTLFGLCTAGAGSLTESEFSTACSDSQRTTRKWRQAVRSKRFHPPYRGDFPPSDWAELRMPRRKSAQTRNMACEAEAIADSADMTEQRSIEHSPEQRRSWIRDQRKAENCGETNRVGGDRECRLNRNIGDEPERVCLEVFQVRERWQGNARAEDTV